MFGLLDCNNFYVSCERVFHPALRNRPVLVLSNNDGCVIARSDEVKALGVEMGTPVFKIRNLIAAHNIAVFSSNYTLYGDMSARVMSILHQEIPQTEIYSIDEAFLNLSGLTDLQNFGRQLVGKITQSTGIPVSLGIAPTKTLAKVANKFAKKYRGYAGCCLIDDENKRTQALKRTRIGDVWGIGRRLKRKLEGLGILTAADFCLLSPDHVRKMMTVTGERLWRELNGFPCLEIEDSADDKKQICNSRSFSEMTNCLEEVSAAVAGHAMRCAEKLRRQNGAAEAVLTFVQSNRFRSDLPQYNNYKICSLPFATDDSLEIVKAALNGLRQIWKTGIPYKKCGVIIPSIVPCGHLQGDLFDRRNRLKSAALMQTLDKLNTRLPGCVELAVMHSRNRPQLKHEHISQHYTTDLNEIISIKI